MAIYVKVNDNETLYPAVITGRMNDENWDNRETKTIVSFQCFSLKLYILYSFLH